MTLPPFTIPPPPRDGAANSTASSRRHVRTGEPSAVGERVDPLAPGSRRRRRVRL